MIPSRYPTTAILDVIARPEDLDLMIELESWTNDRISTEFGILHRLPKREWVTGRPMASVIMAAYCHPNPTGSRFNGPGRGAWYAGVDLDTTHKEAIYHRTKELAEIGVFEARVQMKLYIADFDGSFHDIRPRIPKNEPYHNPLSYEASQALGRELLASGSNGILYRSVRDKSGECLACFRPVLVENVRIAAHFEYRWDGRPKPKVYHLHTDA